MKELNSERNKRTQRDYTLAFKLSIVSEVEKGNFTYKQAQKHYGIQGKSTVLVWLRKYGNLDWSKPISHYVQIRRNSCTKNQAIRTRIS